MGADHFEKIQKLPDPIPGVPNFRRVPGYKVYCCGQPTAAALETTLNKVCGDIYPKYKKIIWFNMRQEPTVYINGEPVCARPPNKIGEYAELGNVTSKQLEEDEAEFVRVCEGQMKANDNKVKVVDVNKQEKEVEVKTIVTLQESIAALLEKFPGLVHIRVPICNSASPNEVDFDTITTAMVGSSINTPVILATKLVCPGQPLAVWLLVFSRSSRSTPPLRASSRLCLGWTSTCSRWTPTPWI